MKQVFQGPDYSKIPWTKILCFRMRNHCSAAVRQHYYLRISSSSEISFVVQRHGKYMVSFQVYMAAVEGIPVKIAATNLCIRSPHKGGCHHVKEKYIWKAFHPDDFWFLFSNYVRQCRWHWKSLEPSIVESIWLNPWYEV